MKKSAVQILRIYKTEFDVEQKSDKSPLTQADTRSHEILNEELEKLGAGPVVSEEGTYSVQKSDYWLIDPLDGTKDFVNRTGEFAINVAFISGQRPIFGAILVPTTNDFTYCERGKGVFNTGVLLPQRELSAPTRAAESVHHGDPRVLNFYRENNITNIWSIGSSLKYVAFAKGEIDVYFRMNPTAEWDTAAGQLFVEECGGSLVDWENLLPLTYNRENPINPPFIVGVNGQTFKDQNRTFTL